ncbi:MAG: hypothetical protein JOS17DRAFT_689290 [Linnemannia elongata]|nr:MAG: hypothetical protein JOS17DRAFT_689290 [Linnemannia elongata]
MEDAGKRTPKYKGPYTIVSRKAGGAYVLRDGTGALLGRPYAPLQLKLALDEEESDTYRVEEIIAHRPHLDRLKGVPLVKWQNYSNRLNIGFLASVLYLELFFAKKIISDGRSVRVMGR